MVGLIFARIPSRMVWHSRCYPVWKYESPFKIQTPAQMAEGKKPPASWIDPAGAPVGVLQEPASFKDLSRT
jgi:hypothetical protein